MKHAPEFVVSACRGKDALTATRAKRLAKEMRRRGRAVDAYHCAVCREWHVGSKP